MRWKLLFLLLLSATIASADTLTLKNGQVINGIFVSRNGESVVFVGPDGLTHTYTSQEVASLTFGPVQPKPAPPAAQMVNVPAGTLLIARMSNTLDTKDAYNGQLFTATLATNLAANGYEVAPAGTTVYGQVMETKSAGRASGTSQLKLQLTQLVIGGNAIPIITDTFDTQGKSSTKRSAKRLLGGAGLGAAIGAIAGDAGMGAAIGAVAGGVGSVVQKGDQVQVPAEAQLQFRLQQPVMIPAMR